MTGKREVRVVITGDADKLTAATDKAAEKVGRLGGISGRLGGTFSKVGGIIGGEFGDVLDKVGDGLDRLGEKEGRLGSKLMAGGGALTAAGVLLQGMASKDQAALQQLNAEVDATGKGFDGFREEVEKAVKAQENYGHKAPQTIDALRILTAATGDPKIALRELATASNLAAFKHIDLASAATMLGKAYNGNAKILKEFHLTAINAKAAVSALHTATTQHQAAVDKLAHAQRTLADIELVDGQRKKLTIGQQIQLRNAHEAVANATDNLRAKTLALRSAQEAANKATNAGQKAVDGIGHATAGQAAAAVHTFTGQLNVLKTKAEDAAASFGHDFGGAVTAAGPVMFGFGAILETGVIGKLGKAGGKVAEQAKELGSLGKSIAVVGGTYAKMGLQAVGGAAKSTAAWVASRAAMLAAAAAQKIVTAAQWLLNAALDANPIGLIIIGIAALAAGLIYAYRHSETFRKIVQGAFHAVERSFTFAWDVVKVGFEWIKSHWPLILGILTGPFGLAVVEVIKHWHGIEGFLHSLPGRVKAVTRGLWDGIKDAFRSAVNWIIDGWNSLHFGLPKIDTHIPGIGKIGGGSFGVPHIPRLEHGGVVRATPGGRLVTVAEGGSDEAVVPLDRYTVHPRTSSGSPAAGEWLQPIQLVMDSRVVAQGLLRLERTTGRPIGFKTVRTA